MLYLFFTTNGCLSKHNKSFDLEIGFSRIIFSERYYHSFCAAVSLLSNLSPMRPIFAQKECDMWEEKHLQIEINGITNFQLNIVATRKGCTYKGQISETPMNGWTWVLFAYTRGWTIISQLSWRSQTYWRNQASHVSVNYSTRLRV